MRRLIQLLCIAMLAVWIPNIVGIIAGIILLRRASR